ncbi:MAG TPA: C-terminal helicase domain-containing protein, partial [Candidatus Sulfotelmatobacter sp.]|nr:C-terminal helicase domain-containing protein [Candidatus Sulfotelmatobacter sp.]
EENDDAGLEENAASLRTEDAFKTRAAEVYAKYTSQFKRRFKWLPPSLFVKALAEHLRNDATALLRILHKCGEWDAAKDAKLNSLFQLIANEHPKHKVLIFTQFADTVRYLENQLQSRGIDRLAGATGQSTDPTRLAWRFSPHSNNKTQQIKPEDELRVLIATDVLSEGQNLQDCFIVVNYDLPWAIVRLIQRAGRVDRIGQHSENIFCYSFLPAEGVERIIRLRARVRQRLQENAEVVGADEAFFEDDRNEHAVLALYHEKAGILDGDVDGEVDLASYAYQIWKNAISRDPQLEKLIPALPPVTYATKSHASKEQEPEGVLVYLRTGEENDALAWIDKDGKSVTESQFAILKAAECLPDTPAIPRNQNHYELVQKGVEWIVKEEKSVGGQLGRPSGARFRTYERLKRHAEEIKV